MGEDRSQSDYQHSWKSREMLIAMFAVGMISLHLYLRFGASVSTQWQNVPLLAVLLFGGVPLTWELLRRLFHREFGSDLLAGISIVVSVLLGEYLAGSLVVLMLSGGEALENFAVSSASSVLHALSQRMPSVAHRKTGASIIDVALEEIAIGDQVVVYPHEACPVDGTVTEGHGVMDESYLTGEPYMMSKTPGAAVLSGAVNGQSALVIRADKLAIDSRFSKIMEVMERSEEQKPKMRRLADQLGAWYTPLAILIGVGAWAASGDPVRFLAVMVVATPCPLLIAIPVAIIGSISLAARRAIIVRDPAALETAETCRTIIFDKTGTLTYGEPKLVGEFVRDESERLQILAYASSLEKYSKHPLADAVVRYAADARVHQYDVVEVDERPGHGLTGMIDGHQVELTSRKRMQANNDESIEQLPPQSSGLECVVLIDGQYAATYQFRDTPRADGASFVRHLEPRHQIKRTMLVSGDRESESQYLADQVGIQNVYASQTPEQKLEIVREETKTANTIFVGDGINDAPALMAATVGVASGQHSDVTTEAADVVVLDSSLQKIDEFLHISRRMRSIALQSALGGMALSVVGMAIASAGYLPPVAGAVCQEVIDVIAVLNAMRVAIPPRSLIDFDPQPTASGVG